MIIYKTTNLINNKIYVGQDSKNNPNYYGSGKILKAAIKKYGKINFKKEILEHCRTRDELNDCEKYWICELESQNPNIGYNITAGGEYSIPERTAGTNNYLAAMSYEEREAHLNKYRRGNNYWLNQGITTEEQKQKYIDENYKGKNHPAKRYKTDEEFKEWRKTTRTGDNFRDPNYAESMRGRNNPIFRGKTEEEIHEWFVAHMYGDNGSNAKFEYIITKSDGTVIKTCSLKSTCIEYGFNHSILRKLADVSTGERESYQSYKKEYHGWTVTKTLRDDPKFKHNKNKNTH